MITEISSHSNARFKYLKSLAKSRNRKTEGLFLAEGRPELDVALARSFVPESIIYCPEYFDRRDIQKLLPAEYQGQWIQLSKPLFDELAYQQVPGNFMALFPAWDTSLFPASTTGPVVVLEHVEKPGNLGAILRTCDALGITHVIVAESDIDLFNPNVIRNSRGAVFTVNCTFGTNDAVWRWLNSAGIKTFAAALTPGAVDYRQATYTMPCAIVLGAESTGLSPFWLERADQQIVIPMLGTVDSLNVSVSCAIILAFLGTKL